MWDGHIVFCDRAVLKAIFPKMDPSIFTQNLKNPAALLWKGFMRSLSENAKTLHPFPPDAR